eukprot:TRINITY_DN7348_c0_g1_i1.p1 TRINITY_DN7348_c0_g1~~TRINITY_DN7348_c0_g1_i1.p1  ORF type:complete len:347 (+),score=60.64 TRINITY_DN7348_c0_g1_i1:241-1281(+)
MSVSAYAALEKGVVVPWSFDPRPLADDEVEIRVTHCGLCHTDVSQIDNDWGNAHYPMVAGHEIVGVITKVGERVNNNRYFEGARVGVGPQRDSCRSCGYCNQADESACSKAVWTYNAQFSDGSWAYGGYATHMRVHHKFVQIMPDAIPSEHAPLLCAGITTYFPFANHTELRPTSRVGIVGVGGLGHLALQFSRAMGYETVAISTSASKREEALSFGATDFLLSTEASNFTKNARSFDLILSTASSSKPNEDLTSYLSLLKPGGTFVLSGVQGLSVSAASFAMIINRASIEGSNIGGTRDMGEMLEFAARHKITPKVEVLPFDQINEALEKVRKGTARYRMVVKRE